MEQLEPARSPAHALGAELRRWRMCRGLSQATLGRLVHHSGSLVSKIENGERVPSSEFCVLADQLLDTGGALAALRPAVDMSPGPEFGCFIEPVWNTEVSLRSARELVDNAALDRRGFLVLVGSALGATALTWSTALAGPPPATSSAPVSLARLASRLADLRALDDELGGLALRDLAVAELRWLVSLAESRQARPGDQEALLGLVAEASRLCAWLHLDAELHATAQGFYVTALRCSADAGDESLGANVLAGMSFQAMLNGRTTEALALLDVAEQRSRPRASSRLAALIASRRARAHARSGDAIACGRALNLAESHLDRAGAHEEPEWLYYFDAAELAAQSGACWADLRQPDRAQPLLDDALAGLAPQFVRDRSIYHVRSAQARYDGGDIDQACAELDTTTTLATRTGSVRAMSTVRDARRRWDDRADHPAVQSVDRLLAALPVLG